MIVRYLVDGTPSELPLPSIYLESARPEDLAELVACDFWRQRQDAMPPVFSLVHLLEVDGADLGVFEVRSELRPVFTAAALSAQRNQLRRKPKC
ncbi:hypothetical protein N5I28_19380 [Pseudomonas mosselii]|uniref:hypothetical protein n=1 Tax=Pseudomonas mosselii TaxID=78327 RepID=UPI0024496074|nr:hypothetical protein [Pseudomonas mosselii]MDH1511912.1 hypothetical protein [Pseudomonas mosselii]